jgi:hypothetical protein
MTEPLEPSKPEQDLAAIMLEANVEYLWGKGQVPPMRHPETGQPHYADFYIPATSLYVEVKGQLTLREITKMARISASSANYYLYQATDPDWKALIADWPSNVMPSEQASKIEGEAEESRSAYLRRRPERLTRSSLSRKGHEAHHRCAVQRGELLFLSHNVTAARAAGRVVCTRLRRYLVEHLDRQGWVTQDVLARLREQLHGP